MKKEILHTLIKQLALPKNRPGGWRPLHTRMEIEAAGGTVLWVDRNATHVVYLNQYFDKRKGLSHGQNDHTDRKKWQTFYRVEVIDLAEPDWLYVYGRDHLERDVAEYEALAFLNGTYLELDAPMGAFT